MFLQSFPPEAFYSGSLCTSLFNFQGPLASAPLGADSLILPHLLPLCQYFFYLFFPFFSSYSPFSSSSFFGGFLFYHIPFLSVNTFSYFILQNSINNRRHFCRRLKLRIANEKYYLKLDFFSQIVLDLIQRNPYLLHGITVADGNALIVFGIKIICNAERRTYLILAAIALADGARVVEINHEALGELIVKLARLLAKLL